MKGLSLIKRLSLLLVAVVMLLSFAAACGQNNDNDTDTDPSPDPVNGIENQTDDNNGDEVVAGLRIIEEPLGSESYGMAMHHGNAALRDAVNAALDHLHATGEYYRIYNMFFGGEDAEEIQVDDTIEFGFDFNAEEALLDPSRLHMVTNAAFPPFEFVNEDGEFDGFDVHLAHAIADLFGVELFIDDIEFAAALAAIEAGQADIAIAAITIRPDREEVMYFTRPYFETTIVAIVPEDSEITTIAQLRGDEEGAVDDEGNPVLGTGEGLSVAVQFATTSDLFAESYLPDAEVIALNRAPDTILELRAGRVDAIIIDRAVADEFVATAG